MSFPCLEFQFLALLPSSSWLSPGLHRITLRSSALPPRILMVGHLSAESYSCFQPQLQPSPKAGLSNFVLPSPLRCTHSSWWLQPSPSQAGNISSHLSSPLPVGQQPSMSNHPQPGPSSLFLPQGFQGSPSPQLHLGYFLVIILTAMQASTPRRHHVLRIHSHLAPYFQSQNFECPAVSATGPGHLFELLPYSPAWLSRCLAGPHSLPCATFHSLPEPCLSSCQVPTHQGEKPIAT